MRAGPWPNSVEATGKGWGGATEGVTGGEGCTGDRRPISAGSPTMLSKIKTREERKQMDPPNQDPVGGKAISFPGGLPTLLSHGEEKQRQISGAAQAPGCRSPLEVYSYLNFASRCLPPDLLSPLQSEKPFMENLEFGICFRFQRNYCSTSCYFYLGVI